MEGFSPLLWFLGGRSFYLQCLCTLTDSYHCTLLPQPGHVNKQSQSGRDEVTYTHILVAVFASAPVIIS